MLDQNTDRMWYVIGAVLIGAAIIFGMNTLMPNAFASVGGNFEVLLDNVTVAFNEKGMTRNLINPDDLRASSAAEILNYDEDLGVWTIEVLPNNSTYSHGLTVKSQRVRVPYGRKLHVSFEVRTRDDAESVTDINNQAVVGKSWRLNDNDEHDSRKFNGIKPVRGDDFLEERAPYLAIPVKANEWTTITYEYENTSEENEGKLTIYDNSRFGITNFTDSPIEYEIRNVEGWFVNAD